MFVVFQFAILAKNHLFTHYAAYAAARSARVYFCPALPITIRSFIDVKTCDDDAAPGKADHRLAQTGQRGSETPVTTSLYPAFRMSSNLRLKRARYLLRRSASLLLFFSSRVIANKALPAALAVAC